MRTSKKLVRFRADPTKVRVSIRHMTGNDGDEYGRLGPWRVTITSLHNKVARTYLGRTPERAVDIALRTSSLIMNDDGSLIFPGIDLDMQWSYRHPFLEEDK